MQSHAKIKNIFKIPKSVITFQKQPTNFSFFSVIKSHATAK